jgi:uncharacterized protein (DUF4415 family)
MNEQRITRRSLHEGRVNKTDWSKVDQLSDTDIEKAAASDPDAAPILDPQWFEDAEVVRSKQLISIRLDREVLEIFKSSGPSYQTRINAVLKSYMRAVRKSG